MTVSIPRTLGLSRGQLLIIGTGAYSVAHLPVWIEAIRTWYSDVAVQVVVTAAAGEFVTFRRLAAAAGSPPWGPDWPTADRSIVPHRELAEWADLILVLPATANSLAKIAAGLADDFAHTVLQTAACPLVIVPAIPPSAVDNPMIRANVQRLRDFGVVVLDSVVGMSASSRALEVGAPAGLPDILFAAAEAVRRRLKEGAECSEAVDD